MAAETLLEVSTDENERARLLTEYKIIIDYQSGLAAAEKKGDQAGEKRGIEIGKIKSAVNAIKTWNISVSEAMNVFQLDLEYRNDVITELKNQKVTFTE